MQRQYYADLIFYLVYFLAKKNTPSLQCLYGTSVNVVFLYRLMMKWFFFLVIGPILSVAQGKSVHSVTGKNPGIVGPLVLRIPAIVGLLFLDLL